MKKYMTDIEFDCHYVPARWKTQVRAVKIYKYYCNVLNKNHDRRKALSSTCCKFGLKKTMVYASLAFCRKIKLLNDPEERAAREEKMLQKEYRYYKRKK